MPAFGFLLILLGVFILINVFNGNLVGLIMGDLQLNFSTPNSNSTSTPPPPKP